VERRCLISSTVTVSEFNGAGQTETGSRTDCDFKAIDDSTSPRGSYPISAQNNENSYSKYWALKFAPTWASISSVSVKVGTNTPAAGLAINGAVVTAYATPSRTSTGDAPMSTSGLPLNLVSSSSAFGSGTSSSTAGGTIYSQAIRAQFSASSSYAGGPGDTPATNFTFSWVES
jgi:hypothetical protein